MFARTLQLAAVLTMAISFNAPAQDAKHYRFATTSNSTQATASHSTSFPRS